MTNEAETYQDAGQEASDRLCALGILRAHQQYDQSRLPRKGLASAPATTTNIHKRTKRKVASTYERVDWRVVAVRRGGGGGAAQHRELREREEEAR